MALCYHMTIYNISTNISRRFFGVKSSECFFCKFVCNKHKKKKNNWWQRRLTELCIQRVNKTEIIARSWNRIARGWKIFFKSLVRRKFVNTYQSNFHMSTEQSSRRHSIIYCNNRCVMPSRFSAAWCACHCGKTYSRHCWLLSENFTQRRTVLKEPLTLYCSYFVHSDPSGWKETTY